MLQRLVGSLSTHFYTKNRSDFLLYTNFLFIQKIVPPFCIWRHTTAQENILSQYQTNCLLYTNKQNRSDFLFIQKNRNKVLWLNKDRSDFFVSISSRIVGIFSYSPKWNTYWTIFHVISVCNIGMAINHILNSSIRQFEWNIWLIKYPLLSQCSCVLQWVPINMPLCASTVPVLGRCCQHRTSTGPVLATNGMFTGVLSHLYLVGPYTARCKSFICVYY